MAMLKKINIVKSKKNDSEELSLRFTNMEVMN